MRNSKPKIGVTGPDKGGAAAWWFTRLALWMQGARAVRIQPVKGAPETELHGLIIGGGADISPDRYLDDWNWTENHTTSKASLSSKIINSLFAPMVFLFRKLLSTSSATVNEARDDMEFGLLQKMMNHGVPVLGICRGAQLINIHQGGDLYDDVSSFYSEVPQVYSIWPKKEIEIISSSHLAGIVNASRIEVNALNHQAINTIGDSLRAAAKEKNGIIQAIEYDDSVFVLGVQWHPEYMPQQSGQRHIFKTLVQEARRYRDHQKD